MQQVARVDSHKSSNTYHLLFLSFPDLLAKAGVFQSRSCAGSYGEGVCGWAVSHPSGSWGLSSQIIFKTVVCANAIFRHMSIIMRTSEV